MTPASHLRAVSNNDEDTVSNSVTILALCALALAPGVTRSQPPAGKTHELIVDVDGPEPFREIVGG